MNQEPIFSTKTGAVYLENGILYTQTLLDEISVEDFREHIQQLNAFFGEVFPLQHIVYPSKNSKSPVKATREFFASDEMALFASAFAIITDSIVTRISANLFLKISPPRFPMQLFTDEAKARQWLLSLRKS